MAYRPCGQQYIFIRAYQGQSRVGCVLSFQSLSRWSFVLYCVGINMQLIMGQETLITHSAYRLFQYGRESFEFEHYRECISVESDSFDKNHFNEIS